MARPPRVRTSHQILSVVVVFIPLKTMKSKNSLLQSCHLPSNTPTGKSYSREEEADLQGSAMNASTPALEGEAAQGPGPPSPHRAQPHAVAWEQRRQRPGPESREV